MSGFMLATGAVAALVVSALVPQSVSSAPDVPTERIEVTLNTVNGSGCPAGTAAVAASPDNSAFTVTYSDYLAQVGGGVSATESRKNCQLNVAVHIPQGFTYAIASVDHRGYAYLQNSATGVQKAQYYFQGSSETASRTHRFGGPYSDNWRTTDTTDVAELVWAPCGVTRNININTEIRVDAGAAGSTEGTSFLAMDSTDGSVNTTYRLAWKECADS